MAKLNVKDTTSDAVKIRQDLFLRMYEKIGVIFLQLFYPQY